MPEITSGFEEGFHDLIFSVRRAEKLRDGSQALRAYGTHHGRQVGLVVVLGPKWPKAPLNSNTTFSGYQGVVTYLSMGRESDSLLQIMDELYATALHPKSMRKETKFTGITLEGDPANLRQGAVKIKLFYETGREDQYAELFTNIDLPNGVLRINEKDEGYRKRIIRALSGR